MGPQFIVQALTLVLAGQVDATDFEVRLTDLALAEDPDPYALQALARELSDVVWTAEPLPEIDWPKALFELRDLAARTGAASEQATYWIWDATTALTARGAVALGEELVATALQWMEAEGQEGDPYLPWLWIERADTARYFGRWSVAREAYERARELLAPSGDPFAEPSVGASEAERIRALALGAWFDVRGQWSLQLGLLEEAERFFVEQERRARILRDPALEWAALDNRMRLAVARDELDTVEALYEAFQAGDAYASGSAAERGRAEVFVGRALVDLEWRDPARDRRAADGLSAALDGALTPYDRIFGEALLGRSLLDRGAVDDAGRVLKSARKRFDALPRKADPDPDFGHLRLFLVAEEARLFRLGTANAIRARRSWLEREITRLVTSWGAAPLRPGGLAYLHFDPSRELIGELVLAHRDEPELALRELVRLQAQGTLARELELEVPSLSELRRHLCVPGRLWIAFVFARSRSFALLLSSEQVDWVELGPAFELDEARRELLRRLPRALRTGDASEADEVARRVRDLFVPAQLQEVLESARELVFVGLGAGEHLPFEWLPGTTGRWGAEFAISYLPSFPLAVWLAQRAPAEPGSEFLLAAGDGVSSGALTELGLPAWELDAAAATDLGSLYDSAQVLAGRDAGFDHVAAILSDARVVQLIAHGLFDPARERPAGLCWSDGRGGVRTVWADEIESLSWPELVVFSVCGLARGPRRRGDDGRAEWSGALLGAGASCVILSPFELDLRRQLDLSVVLHTGVAEGVSPAEALRRARQESPEALEGFVLHAYGLGFRAPLSTPTKASYWWLVPLALLVAASITLRRRNRVLKAGPGRCSDGGASPHQNRTEMDRSLR